MFKLTLAMALSVLCAAAFAADATETFDGDFELVRSGACRPGSRVRVTGVVRDVFTDDVDPDWEHLVLDVHGRVIYVASSICARTDRRLSDYLDATITVVGKVANLKAGSRRLLGNYLVADSPEDITVVQPANADPFDAPPLGDITDISQPSVLLAKHRAEGQVLAVCHDRTFVLQTDDGRIVNVHPADGAAPRVGQFVEAVGQPDSDLFRLNLMRAIWRGGTHSRASDVPEPLPTTAAKLLLDQSGKRRVNIDAHGTAVTLTGTIRSLPAPGNDDGIVHLECGDFVIPVDASSCPDVFARLALGTTVELSGICFMRTGSWSPSDPFPRIEGMTLVLRTPADVKVLARPPWWTPAKVLAAVAALLAAVFGFALVKTNLRRIAANLKVQERTRIALELHDTIAQTLGGVSMEIDAGHTSIASRMLQSCREELRNCLWDLRSRALEENDLNEAIRRTLTPQIGASGLTIRFNVPRQRIPDDTAHSLMRIVRELVTNAVRHGQATRIRIAGSLDGDRLLFSVQDNGSGFDPASAPGALEGHFGLQGIRERVRKSNGELKIQSRPGDGTKVSVSLSLLPQP